VHHYHWMTNSQFLNAVALGQITPGPVVQTVAVVGYAAGGGGGALLAALIAFAPSFCSFSPGLGTSGRCGPIAWRNPSSGGPARRPSAPSRAQRSARPGAHARLAVVILAGAVVAIVGLRRSVVLTLVGAGLAGAVGAALGLPLGG